METTTNKPWLKRRAILFYSLAILALLCFLFYLAWQFGPSIIWNAKLVKSLPSDCPNVFTSSDNFSKAESCSVIMRNFGLTIGITASFFIAIAGLGLAFWGRRIQQGQWEIQKEQWKTQDRQWSTQHTSHLQERFEKATDMLGNESELVRIGGCRSLMNLGINEEPMKSACIQLLSDFIKNPYLEGKEKTGYLNLKSYEKEEYLANLFPVREPLRPDIQSAVSSFLTIYQYYGATTMRNEPAKLPKYFWVNWNKGAIFLAGAYLAGEHLRFATLSHANLEGANFQNSILVKANLLGTRLDRANLVIAKLNDAVLMGAELNNANLERAELEQANLTVARLREANLRGANLKGADFQDADFQDTDISHADMRKVKNLTKEQILSAKWGYGEYPTVSGTPLLPEDLEQDEDIKKWLETPAYDHRINYEDSQ